MNIKLVEMAATAQKAAALQVSAADHQALSAKAREQATMEETEAAERQEEAAVLFEKADTDRAIAGGKQLEVQQLEAEVVVEEEQTAAHVAAGALDEATFEGEMAEATADAADVARVETQARGEEVGIGICEFIPLLDVACDVIGGITAVGLEGLAASEAVKATSEFAAATATKMEEEREIAVAAEFQDKAAEDAAAAAELQTEETAEAELAEEERLTGEEKEAEADALLEQAEGEGEVAVEEEAISVGQEEEAGSLVADSVILGVLSCWDAIMASVFGVLSFSFFAARFASKVVLPGVVVAASATRLRPETTWSVANYEAFRRGLSYNFLHCAVFILVTGGFVNLFHDFPDTSIQARGGILLGFAFCGACIQTFLLHSLPGYLSRIQTMGNLLLHAIRQVISLSVLYILEILILWATVGRQVFTHDWMQRLDHWLWWLFLMIPLAAHTWLLEIPFLATRNGCTGDSMMRSNQQTDQALETDSLLPTTQTMMASQTTDTQPSWLTLLLHDLAKMQLPFEILVLSCITGLLVHCVGAANTLWPTSKTLLLTSRPNWLLPLSVASALLLLGALTLTILCRRQSKSA